MEILSVGHDVSERRQREQQLAYLTVNDPMTGLYNRAYFDTEIDRSGARTQVPGQPGDRLAGQPATGQRSAGDAKRATCC